MDTYQFTSLGRRLDPHYPTNRWIMILGFLVGAGGLAYQLLTGASFVDAIVWAILAAAMVVLAWVVGRELDPDHEYSAFVGPLLALAGVLVFGSGSLLVGLWLVQVLRVVNRTSGLPARVTDSLIVLALGLWMSYQGGWVYGAVTVLAFGLDALLPEGQPHQWAFAGLALIGTLALAAWQGAAWSPGDTLLAGTGLPAWAAALAAIVLFLPVLVGSRQVESVGDATNVPLQPRRVQAAQALALLGGLGIVLWHGTAGLTAWLPFWAAVLGAALYRVFMILRLL